VTDRAPFRPVQTVRAYERIVEQVEQAVLSGALKPGDRLPSERELIVQFRVSRSTVREALRVLESGGFLRSRPGDPHGPEVMPLTTRTLEKSLHRLMRVDEVSLAQLVQFRMLLDGSASYLAARARSDAQLADMQLTLDRMAECVDVGYAEFSEADVAFHDALAKASGNTLIEVCCAAVRGVVVGLIAQKIASAADQASLMTQSLAHHAEVLDAVRAGQGARAAELAREHLYAYYAEHVSEPERQVLADLVAGAGLTAAVD